MLTFVKKFRLVCLKQIIVSEEDKNFGVHPALAYSPFIIIDEGYRQAVTLRRSNTM